MQRWRLGTIILLGLALLVVGRLWTRRGSTVSQGLPAGPSQSALVDPTTTAMPRRSHLFVLAINGGGSPWQNFGSHLLHLQGVVDLMHRAGVPADAMTVLSGDGADPTPDLVERSVSLGPEEWRVHGTELEEYLSHLAVLGNSAVTGANLYPATRGSLSIWLMTVGQQLRTGDTLLLYVTDHGSHGDEPEGNRIVLWGPDASLSVRELRDILDTLDPGVRVVALMSQCYSGGFARLAAPSGSIEPSGRFCGFFSTTAQQKAYGCYPETQDKPRAGHSFAFLQALPAAMGRFSIAHELAQEFDDTPDIPLRTSDLYLGEVLDMAARARGLRMAGFVDDLLRPLWTNSAAFNLQSQRLDRLSDRFGLPTIHSEAECAKAAASIQEALAELVPLQAALDKSLVETNQAELRRFLEIRSDLKMSLDPKTLKAMDLERRVQFGKSFLYDLATFSGGREPPVKQDWDASTRMIFRMRVRLAATKRVQTVLIDIAGERYLAGSPAQQAGMRKLVECEALDLQLPGTEWVSPGPALPPLSEDLVLLEGIVAREALRGVVAEQAAGVGQQIPTLQLVPYRGEIPQAGKPVLLFFWATWCNACKVAVPALLTWAQKHNTTVLAVTAEDESALDQFFMVRQPFPSLIARDPEQRTMSHFGVRSLPSFALLDSQGRLVSPVTHSVRDLPVGPVE